MGLPSVVWAHSDPENSQTRGGHLCPTWAGKDFTKNKANSKQIKKTISKQKKMPISSVNFPLPAVLKSETGDG